MLPLQPGCLNLRFKAILKSYVFSTKDYNFSKVFQLRFQWLKYCDMSSIKWYNFCQEFLSYAFNHILILHFQQG